MAETRAASALRGAVDTFRLLNSEQRTAAVAALLLIASTLGPFSFVEVAEILLAVGVLALLRARAQGRRFHLPFGDGTAIAAAGIWAGVLIVVRLFDRPLGQNLLALACAAVLALAGARERAKRPADDLPAEHRAPPTSREEAPPARRGEPAPSPAAAGFGAPDEAPTIDRGEPAAPATAADVGAPEEAPTIQGGERSARPAVEDDWAVEQPPSERLAREDDPRQPPGET
jgi:hypothetical protein